MIVARKHREDLTERKLCRVKVLAGGALLLDDDQTLESAGLMRAGCEVMVIYTRTEVEAATGADIHGSEDFLHVTIPSHITEIEDLAFEICKKSAYGDNPRVCDYYLRRGIQTVPELDTHHSARVLDNNWARGLCRLWVVGKRGRAWVRRVHW